jgi:hypothetical protein
MLGTLSLEREYGVIMAGFWRDVCGVRELLGDPAHACGPSPGLPLHFFWQSP